MRGRQQLVVDWAQENIQQINNTMHLKAIFCNLVPPLRAERLTLGV